MKERKVEEIWGLGRGRDEEVGKGGRCVFFFQAEDGIRDAQESRGLGDVYKRHLEDIIVIKTDEVDKIYKTLENYKKDMIQAPFGEGHGEKINSEIANNTIIEKAGRYVYLISAENATQIENKILNIIKK
ncbi:hypothetical protein CDFC105_33307 [Clostridioides difficile]|nr:hypothetical protein CDFC105_33307 [Clostridioides difficile]